MEPLNVAFNQFVNEENNKYSSRVQLDEIMKELFYISNKRLIIDLLNSPYVSIVINPPNPYVIVLERNENVPDSYELILKSPEGESVRYSARVLKYWTFDLDELHKNKCISSFCRK